MAAQAPDTHPEVREAALAARRSGKRMLNAARQAAKDMARFEEALEAHGIEFVEVPDNHSPDRAKE